jgi:hypothetical protein
MAQSKKHPDGAQEQLWRDRIEAWAGSGQSQQQFCQVHGIAGSSFSRWKVELKRRDEKAEAAVAARGMQTPETMSWTEVHLPAQRSTVASVPGSGGFEVMLPWGWSVRLGPEFEAESLRRLLSVLEERSC